jgi:hypothetical protein
MATRGTVYAINPRRGMVAIATPDNGFTIIELLGSYEVDVGDAISWDNDTGLGSETYRNETRNEAMDVFVQNHAVAASLLRQQLLL